ncbi:hypothetical protein RFI_38758 [Reticulomyxa filosa]|uniref:Uncharacterized protein n=1 Tax=Reticulomyxa filosa TaxID=46433 RepID=X6LDA3_RETFI|nr:hypothetical protein RFI_38758 [Reticulomyxa filosa]|eukprot:ETN98729.1 hypothetical protein RFI_38758 [Reticulomyxa filosa]
MIGQNTQHGICSSIRSNGKTDMLTTLSNMSANSKSIGGIGINHGIDISNSRLSNSQDYGTTKRQNKMDIDNNNIKRNTTKRKTPDDGLINEEVKKAKHYHSTMQVQICNTTTKRNLMRNKNLLSRKVHFAVDINEQQLIQFANSFNDAKNKQIEQKKTKMVNKEL